MTKCLMSFITAVMAGFFGLSITACSVDYDGNSCDEPELVGTWDAVSSQYYAEGEGYTKPGLATGYWVITDRTITQYDHTNTPGAAEGYSYDGRRLNIGGRRVVEVVSVSQQQMLLRTAENERIYRETTYKRRK